MVEKILNNTTPYGKIRASHEGSLHSSTLNEFKNNFPLQPIKKCPISKFHFCPPNGATVAQISDFAF